MRLKGKKAAIELSMTTIIVVVLSLTLLIMGFILVRTIMCGAIGFTGDINDKVEKEIQSNVSISLDSINEKSLVLIDELGGGTDPVEGEAIAESIVEYIHSKKCLSLITTHYSGVKYLATQIEGIQNASMEYDEEKLLPLYKLRTGIPGSSRAFDISVRMGLQHSIIERARSLVNKDFLRTEETIRLLEKERLKMTDMIDGMNKEIKMYEEKQLVLNELIEKYKENGRHDKMLRRMYVNLRYIAKEDPQKQLEIKPS